MLCAVLLAGCQREVPPAQSSSRLPGFGNWNANSPQSANEEILAIQPDTTRKELVYFFEGSPTDEVAYVHMNMELTKKAIDSSEFQRGSDFANNLGKIKGVDHVSIYRYKIVVFKSPLFEWKEIVPQVVETVRQERAPNAKAVERKIDRILGIEDDLLDFYKKYLPTLPRSSFGGDRISTENLVF
ncbi:MAG: hypothetical protein G01um101444_49 [Parcubacteria group bacterium Gr01-1014_44]|nr:MAG: hypothetical protein G01um101444_49 [Parcubacteria group bacterium Gr01-1014_44]